MQFFKNKKNLNGGATVLTAALIWGIIGGFNPHFRQLTEDPGKYLAGWLWRAVVFFILGLIIAYISLPGLTGALWGLGLSLGLIVFWAINAIISLVETEGNEYPRGFTIPFLYLIIGMCFIFGIGGSGCFQANAQRALIGPVTEINMISEIIAPVDTQHIRAVSKEQARWAGDKVLGADPDALGSRYKVGDFNIQRVNGELWWIAPLEFRGFWKWATYHYTTAYVKVSAEDPSRPAELVDGYEMKYIPSACFGSNLHRYLYTHGYSRTWLTEMSFEIDEDGKPYWVTTLAHPSALWVNPVVDGVVILNPETGEVNEYSVDEVPEWVDRVYPEEYAEQYFGWWGAYIHGWWNTVIKEEGVTEPTGYGNQSHDVYLVWGEDNQPYWVTGMTSASSSDQSLTGIMLMNSRTGESYYYRETGANEDAVRGIVNSEVSNYATWRATQPIPYNIYGELTWVVPVVSVEGVNIIFKKLAIVHARTNQVVLGNNRIDAFNQYRQVLTGGGNRLAPSSEVSLMEIITTLSRVGVDSRDGYTTYYFYCEEYPDKIFTASSTVSPLIPLAREGDQVNLGFFETDESVVTVDRFAIQGIELRISEIQGALEISWSESESEIEAGEAAQDMEAMFEEMSDEEKARLLEEALSQEDDESEESPEE
ncbi:hypothetical protein ACFL14_00800 [Patescibacteria group bacterium]